MSSELPVWPITLLLLFATQVKILNPPRPGKKLCVLDIDYTIFDLNSTGMGQPLFAAFIEFCKLSAALQRER
jgi:hypothetical protein